MRWVAIPVRFDEALVLVPKSVPRDWRHMPVPASTRRFGDAWASEARSLVLRVPSAVISGEFNYLINPRHVDFARLEIGQPERFSFDRRLL
jgi:RES domain-containing protein